MNTKTMTHLGELNSELLCAVENLFVLTTALEEDRFVLDVITKAIRSVYNHITDISLAMQDDIQAICTQEVTT